VSRATTTWLAALLAVLVSCSASDGEAALGSDFDRMAEHFPDTRLVSHTGKEVRFYEDLVRGKKVVIQFMYTSCDGL